MNDIASRAAMAERAAEEGAAVALEYFRSDIAVETKESKTDFVTRADREAQQRVEEVLEEEFPDDEVVGEEDRERSAVPEEGAAWVIDPIDGTNNFVRGLRIWATSVAAVVDGEPVAAATAMPALGDTYVSDADGTYRNGDRVAVSDRTDPETFSVVPTIWWSRDRRAEYTAAAREILERFADMRRFGCAQATMAMVADGTLEGAITNVVTNPWDTVAGVHMVRQAGGVVTDLEGDRWRHDDRGLVVSNGTAHEEVLAAARGIDDGV
ncbi:inositol monophosphatase [Halobacteriales archaeon QS_8_69_26]|nr:MAG: inositol monophosphatase [Halobacteriales archaeon QS_8_69_26]